MSRTPLLALSLVVACGSPTPPPAASPAPAPTSEPAPAEVPAVEPTPEPIDASRTCTRTEDCVIVTGGCVEPAGANRAHAAEAEAAAREFLSRARCMPPTGPHHWEPICSAGACGIIEAEHPEWRGCSADTECLVMEQGCQWTSVASAHEADLRAAFPNDTPCPSILPAMPTVRCLYGSCVDHW